MALKFYTSVAKKLKLKFREFWGKIPTFVGVKWEKLVGGFFVLPPPPPPPPPTHTHTQIGNPPSPKMF